MLNHRKIYKPHEIEKAKKAADMVGPHTWTLKGLHDEKVPRILLVGCQGMGKGKDKKSWQENVAGLMKKVVQNHPDLKPDIILFLGDNHYPSGPSSPVDDKFNSCFYDIYDNNIPCFFISGNHDANFDKKSSKNPFATKGESVSFNQVIHHFLPDGVKFTSTEEIQNYFEQETLQINELQQYNFPASFYSLILGELQLLCLDSNFFAKAYLSYTQGSTDALNQIHFIKNAYLTAKKEGRGTCLNLHVPLETTGKRAFPHEYDAIYYLKGEEIKELNKIFRSKKLIAEESPDVESHNEIIKLICIDLGIKVDIVNAAHDHLIEIIDTFINNSNNNHSSENNENALITESFLQFIVGAGGGTKQEQKSFAKHPTVKYHSADEDYGFGILSYENKELVLDIFTTSDAEHLTYQHLQYKNHEFVRYIEKSNNEEKTDTFRIKTLEICDQYLTILKNRELTAKEKESEKKKELENSNSWANYFPVRFFSKAPMTELVTNVLYYIDYNNTITSYLSYPKCVRNMAYEVNCVHKIRALLNQCQPPDLDMMIQYFSSLENNIPFNDQDAEKIFFPLLKKELMNKEVLMTEYNLDMDIFSKKTIVFC